MPKFKVGDRIIKKPDKTMFFVWYTITSITDNGYVCTKHLKNPRYKDGIKLDYDVVLHLLTADNGYILYTDLIKALYD